MEGWHVLLFNLESELKIFFKDKQWAAPEVHTLASACFSKLAYLFEHTTIITEYKLKFQAQKAKKKALFWNFAL